MGLFLEIILFFVVLALAGGTFYLGCTFNEYLQIHDGYNGNLFVWIGAIGAIWMICASIPALDHFAETFDMTVKIYLVTEDSVYYTREATLFDRKTGVVRKYSYFAQFRFSNQPPTVYVFNWGKHPYKIDFSEWNDFHSEFTYIKSLSYWEFRKYMYAEWNDLLLQKSDAGNT